MDPERGKPQREHREAADHRGGEARRGGGARYRVFERAQLADREIGIDARDRGAHRWARA